MAEEPTSIEDRKRRHVELAVAPASQSAADPGWEDVVLVPSAVPELSADGVDLTTSLLGATLRAPVVIAGMTGGHADAAELNAALGALAQELGLAVGVGSQRAALEDPTLARSFAAVRDRAPDACVIANIGVCQLVDQGSVPALTAGDIARAVEMVRADALAVHLNVVQELVQPEGDRRFDDLLAALAELVSSCPVPVLAKETGAGVSRESARALADAGVAAIDVGGAGGTSFARIEAGRALDADDARGIRLGATFADWGIPTATSVLEARGAGVPLVATGGVRTGLDAAKALALGATAVGLGRPAMLAAQRGEVALRDELDLFLEELRTALILCAAPTPAALPVPVLTGPTLTWAQQRALL